MNGIFIYLGENIENSASGIAKKIKSQIQLFEKNGISIKPLRIGNEVDLLDEIKFVLPFINSNYEQRILSVLDNIDIKNIDVIYFRFPVQCTAFVSLLKKIKSINKNCKLILELPTYPQGGERRGLKRVLNYLGRGAQKKLHRYIDRIVTFSRDKEIWGIKTIICPNCVDFNNIKIVDSNIHDTINLISVASNDFWHGYDRLLEGLKNYYNNRNNNKRVEYYLVGDGSTISEYREFIKNNNLDEYVHLMGSLFGKELDTVYNMSDIGIDALGRHRSNVEYNSSLKGKEYIARGLPIVSGVKTELDYEKNYKYYLRVPADDSPIDIEKVISFYRECCEGKTIDVMRNEIRCFGYDRYDYATGYKNVITYITGVEN